MNRIDLKSLPEILSGRPGLVVGPDICSMSSWSAVQSELWAATLDGKGDHQREQGVAFADYLDGALRDKEIDLDQIQLRAAAYFKALLPNANPSQLAQGRWSAIISLTYDLLLEEAIENQLRSSPTSWQLAIVADQRTVPRQLQLPAYKLLGSLRADTSGKDLALSRSSLVVRRNKWPAILTTLRDYVREGALLFLGTNPVTPLIRELLGSLIANRPPYPGRLVFLSDDPASTDPVISSLAREGGSSIYVVDSASAEIVKKVRQIYPKQQSLDLIGGSSSKNAHWATEFKDFVALVNSNQPSFSLQERRHEVLDALFRPADALDWTPFAFSLDLVRSQTNDLTDRIEACHKGMTSNRPACVLVRGEAGIGKTSLAKRVAFNLSKAGHSVLWCKRAPLESPNAFARLAHALKRSVLTGAIKEPPIIFCDDPWKLRVNLADLFNSLESEGIAAAVVVIFRNSDYAVQGGIVRLPLVPIDELEVAFELDAAELSSIPGFLIDIGAASDRATAAKLVSSVKEHHAKDILCSLWYLLPDTRGQITESLQDEYF